MTTTFDAGDFARGWLSVALASSNDEARPQLYRTVLVELYPEGVRLVATDSYMLLTSFVPAINRYDDTEPGVDEKPVATAIAIDMHGRAKGFLGHMLKLEAAAAKQELAPPELRMSLGIVDSDDDQSAFEGFEVRWLVLEHPDNERLRLQSYEGTFPTWQTLTETFKGKSTKAVALNPDLVGRLCKLGKLHGNRPLVWEFGGANKAARVSIEDATPRVDGLVMPLHNPATDETPNPDGTAA
jgi:hypothetical protein